MEATMTDVRLQERLPTQPQADPVALRRITVWLVGGEAQPETTRVALDLARATGAQLTGFTAFDLRTHGREAAPIERLDPSPGHRPSHRPDAPFRRRGHGKAERPDRLVCGGAPQCA